MLQLRGLTDFYHIINFIMTKTLIKSTLFKGLTEPEINSILSSINYKIENFTKGDFIVGSGDISNSAHVVLKGVVGGESMDNSGKIVKIETIYAPDSFALAFLFAESSKYLVDVIAHSDAQILSIPRNDFLTIIQENPIVLNNTLQLISNKFIFLIKKLKFLTQNTIKQKLLQYIQNLSYKSVNNIIILDRTQQELAEYIGVTRPALARAFSEMEEEGDIIKKGKKIILTNNDNE